MKTVKNDNTRCSGRERIKYLNIIAQKEAEKAAIIAEKNAVIEYYRRSAEQATRSKHRALDNRSEQRRDIIAWGIFAVSVALAIWLTGAAAHEFILWASGR